MGAANLETYAGDDLPISLELLDGEGDAFDLTGYSWEVVASWNNGNTDITLDSEDLTVVEAAGTIEGNFTGAQTESMPEGRETKLLLRLTNPTGKLTTIRIGRIKVVYA